MCDYCVSFNNCLNNGYFLTDWKIAKIIPIFKKGKDPTDPKSYRPICLLPNISKFFEKIIKRFTIKFFESNNLIPDCQFGQTR